MFKKLHTKNSELREVKKLIKNSKNQNFFLLEKSRKSRMLKKTEKNTESSKKLPPKNLECKKF